MSNACPYGHRLNLASDGKRFYAEFMAPGLVKYNLGGRECLELITKETIDDALAGMKGAPLTVEHPSIDVIESGNFTDVSHGVVDNVGFNAETGCYFAEGTVDTDIARGRIQAGYTPSSGFEVCAIAPANGRTWHNIRFNQQDTKIRFHHLAIVPKPRYEESKIRLNSNPTMLKLLKRIVGGAGAEPKVETCEVSPETKYTLPDGRTVTLQQLTENHRLNSAPALDPKVEVEIAEGKTASIESMAEDYAKANPAERANAGHRANADETEEEKKKREEKEKEEKKDEKERMNRANSVPDAFTTLANAAAAAAAAAAAPVAGFSGSLEDGVALGRARYGKLPTHSPIVPANGSPFGAA